MAEFQITQLSEARWSRWRIVSIGAHAALVLLIWLGHPLPPLLHASSVAGGNSPNDYRLVYLGPTGEDVLGSSEMKSTLSSLTAPVAPGRRPKVAQQEEPRKDAEFSDHAARAGSLYGSLDNGPADGRDVRPAYPVVYPDPPISRWLAGSVNGDVVVEVTIDEQGNVISERLLQGVRDDINEKIIATLQTWRFNPASIDGVRVVSREDMHFHFPG